jgi:hypothetical protein
MDRIALGGVVVGMLGLGLAIGVATRPSASPTVAAASPPTAQTSSSMLATEGADAPMKPRPITTAAEIAEANALNDAKRKNRSEASEAGSPNSLSPFEVRTVNYLASVGKPALEAQLREPSSATYRNVIVTRNPVTAGLFTFCGEVNSKNGFGGYSGFEPFVVIGRNVDFASSSEFADHFKTYCSGAVPVGRFDF